MSRNCLPNLKSSVVLTKVVTDFDFLKLPPMKRQGKLRPTALTPSRRSQHFTPRFRQSFIPKDISFQTASDINKSRSKADIYKSQPVDKIKIERVNDGSQNNLTSNIKSQSPESYTNINL